MTRLRCYQVCCFILGMSVTACEDKKNTTTATTTVTLPTGLMVDNSPGAFVEVSEAKSSARQDSEIIVRGRIGGGKAPFVDGRTVFTLADIHMPPCNANPDDHCPTPWDYCCEPQDRIAANTLTVQIVGPDKRPLRQSIAGVQGLVPLAEIVVRGRVSAKADRTLVLDASAIHVRQAPTSSKG